MKKDKINCDGEKKPGKSEKIVLYLYVLCIYCVLSNLAIIEVTSLTYIF